MTLHVAWTITGTVDDIYRPGAITATADDSLEQVAARLGEKDISALVVLDGYRLAGIITERDIVRAVADRRDLAEGTAGEYMTWEPATVGLETPLAEVARMMLALACVTCRWWWQAMSSGWCRPGICWSWRPPRRPDARSRPRRSGSGVLQHMSWCSAAGWDWRLARRAGVG